ncbi:MAG TPA: cytochrome c oxidase assembly protein [Stellaceae bacterium]|jgi:cytochrome c oxidase assembly factor CtaG|nr:cytochrome c oxidase assembly protein [Stellaceae bacterium]
MSAWSAGAALPQFLCTAGDPAGSAGLAAVWTFDLWITAPLATAAVLYATGLLKLWRRAGFGRGIRGWQAGCYAAGWLVLVLALVSPIHHWGAGLFTIHMTEHELVMAVAAPLLVLARPGGAFAWSLPRRMRPRLLAIARSSWLRRAWATATRPGTATILHGAAIWLWHVPLFYEATLDDVALHRLQHVSFLVTGVLFWWALIRARQPGSAAGHLFATMLHTSVLGALMTLAPRVVYPLQTEGALTWGLSPLEDQQLAGLVMWIPAGAIYAAAALLCFALWVRRPGIAWEPGHVVGQT